MKNIHVLPTDKPSLYRFVNGILKKYNNVSVVSLNSVYIYITDDSKIKEGDWWLNIKTNDVDKCTHKSEVSVYNSQKYQHIKKIILTTDTQLIVDDVQSIDDEFLEWFVKNPSCESVEVETKITKDGVWTALKGYVELPTIHSIKYKIIIPKAEPKQEKLHRLIKEKLDENEPKQEMSARLKNSLTQFNLYIEEALELEDWKLKTIGFSNKSIIELRNLTPKQETLGEARKYAELSYYGDEIDAFVSGVKWQQEQDKKMYSEVDLEVAYFEGRSGLYSFNEWIKQFKKK
jgi:hypothetical protein